MANLRVLIVEDDPLDAELVIRELEKSGYEPAWRRVDDAEAFDRALDAMPLDMIISDHAMPQFSSADALARMQQRGLSVPFIVVSHAIGEEEAVRLMRHGASDYLMKDRLGRLGEAVRTAVDQRRLRDAHAAAQLAIVALNEDLERRIAERTAELQASHRRLENELDSRKRAEEALQRLNAELEQRVERRTRDIVASQRRLRELASELTVTEQRERKRLAAELHDYLAQMMALGRMKIGMLRPALTSMDGKTAAAVLELDDLFHKALTYTRSLMAKLSPPVLDELGLPAALQWLAEQMPKDGLTVAVRVPDEPLPLPEDQAVLLFQSVRELLLNVAKHARTNHAVVALRVGEDRHLHIAVQDRGEGFDATALDSKPSGEHFGLFSVRERMEAMGGRLLIESAKGQGTTITLSLPLKAAEPASTPASAPAPRLPEAKPDKIPGVCRLLLVDDHAMVRQGLRAILDGYPDVSVVGEAGDGQEALAQASQLDPDLVLMDINMPWMDGVEATKRIKQEWPEMAVIGLSVNNSPQILDAMRAAGASAFVSKDAAAEQLHDVIAGMMRLGVTAKPLRPERLG